MKVRIVPFVFTFLIGLGMLGYGVSGFYGRKVYRVSPAETVKTWSFNWNDPFWLDYWFENVGSPQFIHIGGEFFGSCWFDNLHIPGDQKVIILVERYPFKSRNNGEFLENWEIENLDIHYYGEDSWFEFYRKKFWLLPPENGTLKLTILEPRRHSSNDEFIIMTPSSLVSVIYLESIELRGFLRDKSGKSVENVGINVWLENSLIASGFFSGEYYFALPPMKELRIVAFAEGYEPLEEVIKTGTEDMRVDLVFSKKLPISTKAVFTAGGSFLMGMSLVGLVWTRKSFIKGGR